MTMTTMRRTTNRQAEDIPWLAWRGGVPLVVIDWAAVPRRTAPLAYGMVTTPQTPASDQGHAPLTEMARRAAAADARRIVADAAAAAAARLAARNRAALAAVADVRQRCEGARLAAHQTRAARAALARAELVAAARLADYEMLVAGEYGLDRADTGDDGDRPLTVPQMLKAVADARAEVDRARLALTMPPGAAAARLADATADATAARQAARQRTARQADAAARSGVDVAAAIRQADAAHRAALAADYGGTTAGRDNRRAAIHQARQHAPLPTGHRAALARQLADGTRRQRWAGNGDAAAHHRAPANRALVTASPYNRAVLVGTDARTGTVSATPGGTVFGAVARPIEVVPPTARPDDLTVTQWGRVLVRHGVVIAERDAQWDEMADAVRRQAETTVGAPAETDWRDDGRTGQVALVRALAGGTVPLADTNYTHHAAMRREGRGAAAAAAAARQIGDAIIAADDARQAAADAAAADAAAADAAAPLAAVPTTATLARCVACGRTHAAIVACGDA